MSLKERIITFLDGFVAGYVENRFSDVPVEKRGSLLHSLTHEISDEYRNIIFPFSNCVPVVGRILTDEEIEKLKVQA